MTAIRAFSLSVLAVSALAGVFLAGTVSADARTRCDAYGRCYNVRGYTGAGDGRITNPDGRDSTDGRITNRDGRVTTPNYQPRYRYYGNRNWGGRPYDEGYGYGYRYDYRPAPRRYGGYGDGYVTNPDGYVSNPSPRRRGWQQPWYYDQGW
ncbi:hypothetical protein WDZ92_37000 [Nostoc sp. NIES-2111]